MIWYLRDDRCNVGFRVYKGYIGFRGYRGWIEPMGCIGFRDYLEVRES